MVGKKQPDETFPVDDVAGMAAQRPEFHQSPFTVLRVQAESHPYERRGADGAETDAHPLVDARHVHDDEHYEQGEQPAGEDEQVLAFQPLELRAAPDPLVDRVLRHNHRKNERRMVAATIKNIQAPNHEAAVLEVSGSPDENLE